MKCDVPSTLAWGFVRITTPRGSFLYHINREINLNEALK